MPAQYTLDEIKAAAQNAFKKGSYEEAQTLDDLYKSQWTAQQTQQQPQQQPQQPVTPMAAYQAKVASDKADNSRPQDGPFEGYGAEFTRGIDQPLEQLGVTADAVGYKGVGEALKGAVDAVPGQSASAKFMEGEGLPSFQYLPKAVVGQAGQFIGSIVTRIAGMVAGGALGSVIPGAGSAAGAAIGGIAGPALFEGLQQLGPIAIERAQNNGRDTPNQDDWIWSAGTSTGSGLLNAIAPGMSGLFKRAVVEGGTEATQSLVQQTGSTLATDKGLEVSGRDAIGEGIIGMGSAAAVDTALTPITAAANLVSGGGSKPSTERESQARAAFAKRITSKVEASTNADGPAYDLTDVDADSRSGAKAVIDSAHSDMSGRLKTLVALLKARIAPDKADRFDTVIEKSDASLAAVKAKNKVKNVVDAEDFAAFEALVGDTAEGQEAINLMHEMNELTRVYSNGLTGGLSRFTDNLNPLGGSANYSGQAAQKAIAPYASLAGFIASPTITAAQVGGFVGGRAIDKLTGRRSRVATYVAQNQGNPGQRQPTGPSLRDQEVDDREREAAQVEQEKMLAVQEQQQAQAQQDAQAQQQVQDDADLDERIYNQGGMPAAEGPEGTLSSVLGLDTEQLMDLLDQVIETEPNPELVDAAIGAQQSIVRGGKVPNLTRLIRILKPRINPDPQFWIERERGMAQQGAQVKLSRQEENYQRGIENNRKAAAALSDELNADNSVSKLDKALLLKALQDLQLDLGINPVATLESMYARLQEKNVDAAAIDQYLGPYLERVVQQQESKQQVLSAQDEVQDARSPVPQDPVDSAGLSRPALELDSSPSIIPVLDGSETPPKLVGKTEVGKYLEQRALEKIGRVRDISDPTDRSAIADDMVAEAIYEMNAQDSAMDWYDSTIEKMLEMLAVKYPEISSDPMAKTPMLVALSIMSQNMDVPTNLKIAEKAYEHFRDTGTFAISGQGKSKAVMMLNFEKANQLLEELGSIQELQKFLEAKFTVRDLNTVLKGYLGEDAKVGGENMDTEVYGSAVFGPKVGNGFYTNLRGDFSPVTMDMWFMRTVGRLKGKVMDFDEAKFEKQLDRLKKGLGRKRISKDDLIAKAFELVQAHEKDYKLNRKLYDLPKGNPKRKVKSESTLAAYTIKGSLKNTIDAPSSGQERNDLREMVKEAVDKFNAQTGLEIQPAAFQALIWYPEQDLYKSLGVKLKHVRQDYASSAKKLLLKEGYNEKDLDSALDRVRQRREQGSGSVRQSTAESEQGRSQAADLSPGGTLPQAAGGILGQVDSQQLKLPFGKPDVYPKMAKPTVVQVKNHMDKAQEILEVAIGKPGSKFEKGVSTEADIIQIAEVLNIFPRIFDNRGDYQAASGKSQNDTSIGNFLDYGDSKGEARVLAANVIEQGKPIGNLNFLITMIHEIIGHGLESRDYRNAKADSYSMSNFHPQSSGYQHANSGSLRGVIAQTLGIALDRGGSSKQEIESARKIRAEIEAIQDEIEVSFENAPELGTTFLRDSPIKWEKELIAKMEKGGEFRKSIERQVKIKRKIYQDHFDSSTDYTEYKRNNAEFSVDPVILYVMNPTLMKKVAPETAELIRGHFNTSKIPVSFHANPIATILAIIMSGIAAMDDEEEEKNNPGALTPEPGALTA